MCYPVQCPACGKTGWGGCGQHIDNVMSSVPASQRCTCTGASRDDPPPKRVPMPFRTGVDRQR
jgi:hypothetical protein